MVTLISEESHMFPQAFMATRKDTWDLALSDHVLWEYLSDKFLKIWVGKYKQTFSTNSFWVWNIGTAQLYFFQTKSHNASETAALPGSLPLSAH